MPATSADAPGNLPEYTVSELSHALKRTVEDAYAYVRVRGEISGFKRAASGHLYMALKDADALIDGVCWRGAAGRLSIKPEDGLEVVATGRLTTFAQRSKYQIVIDSLELAGEGALLKLLEERRKKLAAEGLFEASRKRPIPFLPTVIGVVTSPTGAVIRDILHRIGDRFPRHVLLAPVLVQGDRAAEQIAAAIRGFSALAPGGAVPRPDVLIVARGGGSLEDLWAFNEEEVVRAAAECTIPLISAVGHETDTTLIDFAADRRAPTPTAAAEIAVPVRTELVADVMNESRRLVQAMARRLVDGRTRIEGLGRGLPDAASLIGTATQRLDVAVERLENCGRAAIDRRAERVRLLAAQLKTPREMMADRRTRLDGLGERLENCGRARLREKAQAFGVLAARLSPGLLSRPLAERGRRLAEILPRLRQAGDRRARNAQERLAGLSGLLDSYSPLAVLKRGYVIVEDAAEAPVVSAGGVKAGDAVTLRFHDGSHPALIASPAAVGKTGGKTGGKSGGKPGPSGRQAAAKRGGSQGSLL